MDELWTATLWAWVLLGVGVVGLVVLAVSLLGALRRYLLVQRRFTGDLHDRTGLIKARMAGVRMAVAERRDRPVE